MNSAIYTRITPFGSNPRVGHSSNSSFIDDIQWKRGILVYDFYWHYMCISIRHIRFRK